MACALIFQQPNKNFRRLTVSFRFPPASVVFPVLAFPPVAGTLREHGIGNGTWHNVWINSIIYLHEIIIIIIIIKTHYKADMVLTMWSNFILCVGEFWNYRTV